MHTIMIDESIQQCEWLYLRVGCRKLHCKREGVRLLHKYMLSKNTLLVVAIV